MPFKGTDAAQRRKKLADDRAEALASCSAEQKAASAVGAKLVRRHRGKLSQATIVPLTVDHGEEVGAHDLFAQGTYDRFPMKHICFTPSGTWQHFLHLNPRSRQRGPQVGAQNQNAAGPTAVQGTRQNKAGSRMVPI